MASDRRRLRIERLLDEAENAVARYNWQAVREAAQAGLPRRLELTPRDRPAQIRYVVHNLMGVQRTIPQ